MRGNKIALILTLDKGLFRELVEEARKRGMSVFELIEEILESWVDRECIEDEMTQQLYDLLEQLNRKINRLIEEEDDDFENI